MYQIFFPQKFQNFLYNIFSAIRDSNDLVNPEVDNEDITGVELGYQYNGGDFKANVNFYYTDWQNRVIVQGGGQIVDPSNPANMINVNFFDRNINQVHRGFELEAWYTVCQGVKLSGYLSSGSYEFKGTIDRDTFDDDTNQLISSSSENVDGVKVTSVPQFTAGLGVRAKIIQGLSVDANVNYYAGNYLDEIDFDSDIQTINVGTVNDFSLTDIGLTYDFELAGQQLTFRGNVYNVFDAVRTQRTDVFGFIFTNGRTFNASMKYRF